jgi:hypothetical protein
MLAPEHVSGLAVADVTAVVPISQITLEVTAAHFVSLNRAAPIPQSENGFGPEPGVLSKADTFKEEAQTAIATELINIFILFMLYPYFIIIKETLLSKNII